MKLTGTAKSGCLACAIAMLAACGGGGSEPNSTKKRTYYFISESGSGNPFWGPLEKGFEDAAENYGVKAIYQGPSGTETFEEQPRQMEAAIAAQASGIAVTLCCPDAVYQPIQDAYAAHIPVIIVNDYATTTGLAGCAGTTPSPYPAGTVVPNTITYVGQDDRYAGQQSVVKALQIAGKNSFHNVLCIEASPSGVWALQRCSGVQEAVLGSGTTVTTTTAAAADANGNGLITVATGAGATVTTLAWDAYATEPHTSDLQNTIANLLQQNTYDYVVSTATPTTAALLAETATVSSFSKANTVISSFDTDSTTASTISSGALDFTVDQQPYLQGYMPIVLFEMYNDYLLKIGANTDFATGPFFIDKNNVGDIGKLVVEGYR